MIKIDVIFDELIGKIRQTQVLFETNRVTNCNSRYIDKNSKK